MRKQKEQFTLGAWLSEWYKVYKLPTVSKSTAENIERVIRIHIPQWLKDMRLNELRAFTIDKALSGIPSTRMRKYAFHVLNNGLNKAFRLDYLESDIMKKAEPIKHRSKLGEALTITEQREFLRAVGNHYMRNLFEFYLYTGVRRCEALALRWCDVDFESETILIRLEKQKAQCPDSLLVFPYKKCYVSEVFKRFCPAHKLHDLRHTFVTRCAECGINVNVCQSLAGHSDIKVTLQTYTHTTNSFRKSEYRKFNIEPPQ